MERYRVITQVGVGTYGSVWEAVDRETGDTVAIKKMKRRLSETRKIGGGGTVTTAAGSEQEVVVSLATDPKLATALGGREARSLLLLSRNAARRSRGKTANASNDNDCIVRLLDVVAQRDALYLVFERMECDAHQFLRAVSCGVPLALQLQRGGGGGGGGGGNDNETSTSTSTSTSSSYFPPFPRSPAGGLPEAAAAAWAGSLLRALAAVHAAGLVHRDVKPENLLVGKLSAPPSCFSSSSRQHERQGFLPELPPLKLADFGLARPPPRGGGTVEAHARENGGSGGEPLDVEGGARQQPCSSSPVPPPSCPLSGDPPLTQYVSTRWYRSPEILFRAPDYSAAADVWAAGCVVAELLTSRPLFPGETEADQLGLIAACLGPPPPAMARRAPAPAAAAARAGAQAAMESFRQERGGGGGGVRQEEESLLPLPRAAAAAQLSARLGRFVADDAVDFLSRLLSWDPNERMTAKEALRHPFLARHGVVSAASSSESSSKSSSEEQEAAAAKEKKKDSSSAFEVSASATAATARASPFFDVEAAPAFRQQQQQQQAQGGGQTQQQQPQPQRQQQPQEMQQQELQQQQRFTSYCRAEPAEAARIIDHWTPRFKAEAAAAYARVGCNGGNGSGGGGGGGVDCGFVLAGPTAAVAFAAAGGGGGVGSESGGGGSAMRIRAHRDGPVSAFLPSAVAAAANETAPRARKALAFPREEEGGGKRQQQQQQQPLSLPSAFPPPPPPPPPPHHHHHHQQQQQQQQRLPRPHACPRADSDLAGAASALEKALGGVQSSPSSSHFGV